MTIGVGSRRVRTPSGVEWRVGRQWSPRRLPHWRRVRLGKGGEEALEAVWSIPPVDVGSLEGVEALLAIIVAAVVIAVIVIPLLLFGIELIVVGLLVAAGILARSMFARPWIVIATPCANPAGALAWEVRGWRRSVQLIEEVSAELAGGHTPSPAQDPKQATPGFG